MIVCQNCKHEQETGKFCEACGQPIPAATEDSQEAAAGMEAGLGRQEGNRTGSAETHRAVPTQTQESMESNQQTGNTENVLIQYWNYFLTLLKNPTNAFQKDGNHFIYGLITIGLYSLLFSLSIYFLANSLFKSISGGFLGEGTSLPFSITFRLLVIIVVILAIAFFSAFAVIKMAKNTGTFQAILSQFGGLLVPFTVLHAIGLLGGLIGSIQLTMIPILIALMFSISYVPVLLVYEKVASLHSGGQRVYLSLATVLIMSLVFYILGDAWLMDYFDEIDNMMGYPF